jgi:hypothetical protein
LIELVLTLVLFPLVGAAIAVLSRLPLPPSPAARLAFFYLTGLGGQGALLYALGAFGVPLGMPVFVALPLLSLAVVAVHWRHFTMLAAAPIERDLLATFVFALPLVVLLCAAAVIPTRDYDGRVTWLPKARAIALERSIDGPFFHGQRGLNLHNRYPLLLPLDAATVMRLAGDTRNEAARWMYVLIPVAALLVLRAMLRSWFGTPGGWIAAAVSWLPALTAIEGGALAAYNDFALAAFAGVAVLYLMEALTDTRALRVAGLFSAFAVLAKNEGAALAVAIVVAAVVVRRWRSRAEWLQLLAPIAIAEAIVVWWRTLVPAAYDEQYEVLISELPRSFGRVPAALLAFARHASDVSEWGWFWIIVAAAIAIGAWRDCSPRFAIPLVMLVVALAAYTTALTVTSWEIAELASVAVNRLLAHLLIPAACLVASAVHAMR